MEVSKKMKLSSCTNKQPILSSYANIRENEPSFVNEISSYIQDCIAEYLQMLDGKYIKEFLEADKCCILADRYLLAVVFTYFIRAEFNLQEFTPYNFFVALYLAHDIEEENDDLKTSIFLLATQEHTIQDCMQQGSYINLLRSRDVLWRRMKHRALVSLDCCLKVTPFTRFRQRTLKQTFT